MIITDRAFCFCRKNIDLLSLQQSENFSALDAITQSHIQTFSQSNQQLFTVVEDHYIKLDQSLSRTQTALISEHTKTRAEIISATESLVTDEHMKTHNEIIAAIKESVSTNTRTTSSMIKTTLQSTKPTEGVDIETHILDSLRFRTMIDRQEEIA